MQFTFCDTDLKIPNFMNSGPTTDFILVLNNLFDILNSRNFNSGRFKRCSLYSTDIFSFFPDVEIIFVITLHYSSKKTHHQKEGRNKRYLYTIIAKPIQ